MSRTRTLFGIALVAMVVFLGYRVVLAGMIEEPGGGLSPAERLREMPLDGAAFANIVVARRGKEAPEVDLQLHEIAVRRDPRDMRIRAWLADYLLKAGENSAAIEQLDVILRLAPQARKAVLAMMVELADDPAFGEALAAKLRDDPVWRTSMLGALRADVQRPGAGIVFASLRETGDIEEVELNAWLDALMKSGDWGLAYSYWASTLDLAPGEPLPMVYNGQFEALPSQTGFDWRTGSEPGSYAEFSAVPGARGRAAHLVFSGRPVDRADLQQALALPAGNYKLSMRVQAASLRSYHGLRWALTCHGQADPIAVSAPIEGSFGWRDASLAVEVPEAGCPGQWLRLDNPAPSGSASSVSGELWVDDVRIGTPLSVQVSD